MGSMLVPILNSKAGAIALMLANALIKVKIKNVKNAAYGAARSANNERTL